VCVQCCLGVTGGRARDTRLRDASRVVGQSRNTRERDTTRAKVGLYNLPLIFILCSYYLWTQHPRNMPCQQKPPQNQFSRLFRQLL
jgi:hypothetical protein